MTPHELAEELRILRRLHPYQVPPGVEDAAAALEALAARVAELERLGAAADEATRALGVLAGEYEARALAAEAEVARLQAEQERALRDRRAELELVLAYSGRLVETLEALVVRMQEGGAP